MRNKNNEKCNIISKNERDKAQHRQQQSLVVDRVACQPVSQSATV